MTFIWEYITDTYRDQKAIDGKEVSSAESSRGSVVTHQPN